MLPHHPRSTSRAGQPALRATACCVSGLFAALHPARAARHRPAHYGPPPFLKKPLTTPHPTSMSLPLVARPAAGNPLPPLFPRLPVLAGRSRAPVSLNSTPRPRSQASAFPCTRADTLKDQLAGLPLGRSNGPWAGSSGQPGPQTRIFSWFLFDRLCETRPGCLDRPDSSHCEWCLSSLHMDSRDIRRSFPDSLAPDL